MKAACERKLCGVTDNALISVLVLLGLFFSAWRQCTQPGAPGKRWGNIVERRKWRKVGLYCASQFSPARLEEDAWRTSGVLERPTSGAIASSL